MLWPRPWSLSAVSALIALWPRLHTLSAMCPPLSAWSPPGVRLAAPLRICPPFAGHVSASCPLSPLWLRLQTLPAICPPCVRLCLPCVRRVSTLAAPPCKPCPPCVRLLCLPFMCLPFDRLGPSCALASGLCPLGRAVGPWHHEV